MKIIRKLEFDGYRRMWKKRIYSRIQFLDLATNRACLILVGTPEYCNLGDHLIALAESIFLDNFLVKLPVVEITRELYENATTEINSFINKDTVKAVFITGGGFLGSLWEQMDDNVLNILNACRTKPVFILPQTVFYEANSDGRLKKDKDTFAAVNKLKLYTRDRKSYETVVNSRLLNSDQVSFKPDMALYLFPYEGLDIERKGVALCMRGDRESTLSADELTTIKKFSANLGLGKISKIETVDKYKSFLPEQRKEELDKFFNIIASKRLVITNRLHCMIFCFLTHTPCIAIDNISHKITGVYDWIKDCEFIKCIDDFSLESLQTAYEEVKDASTSYDGAMLEENFKAMAAEIREVLG